ncbi:hypothetical protein V3C99_006697, partial [Haemonchus contortus]
EHGKDHPAFSKPGTLRRNVIRGSVTSCLAGAEGGCKQRKSAKGGLYRIHSRRRSVGSGKGRPKRGNRHQNGHDI